MQLRPPIGDAEGGSCTPEEDVQKLLFSVCFAGGFLLAGLQRSLCVDLSGLQMVLDRCNFVQTSAHWLAAGLHRCCERENRPIKPC